MSPDASFHIKTAQDYFSRGQTQFEPLITSILICSQKRVNVYKKELKHPHPSSMGLI